MSSFKLLILFIGIRIKSKRRRPEFSFDSVQRNFQSHRAFLLLSTRGEHLILPENLFCWIPDLVSNVLLSYLTVTQRLIGFIVVAEFNGFLLCFVKYIISQTFCCGFHVTSFLIDLLVAEVKMKVELCAFSGYKIYPGHGRTLVKIDGKSYKFLSSKTQKGHDLKRNPRKITWTVLYR